MVSCCYDRCDAMKRKGNKRKYSVNILVLWSLIFSVLCLIMGFVAITGQIKIQSNDVTAHQNELNFRVVFSTSNKSEKIEPIIPKIEPRNSTATAQNAKIINRDNPILTNLKVNFTEPGQRARYTFYVYNAGEYMAYLNDIIYSKIAGLNKSKVCIAKEETNNELINKICDDIQISIKIGDIHTNKSMYNLNNKYLRSRTAQMVEVTIEYLNNGNFPDSDFEVIFGDIHLQYSMFPGNNSDNKSEVS